MSEKKSSRATLRHDYSKVKSEGFSFEQSEIPSDKEVVVAGGAKEGCHSSSTGRKPSQSDETLLLLVKGYESLVREEEELQNESRINKLKKKISHKRKSLAELRSEYFDLSPELASCTLQDLRKKKNLKFKAKKELKKAGFLESSSDSESESSSSDGVQSYRMKNEQSGKKSRL
jgi:hypothetical protein